MVTRNTQFAFGEYYHVYNRGVEKRVVFNDQSDHQRFQDLLYLANSSESINVRDIYRTHDSPYEYERIEQLVAIGAYCLMPNHFHILLTPLVDDGVARFMGKLGTSYSMYFNKRTNRTGRLFESTYKTKHVSEDRYLKYLYAYIHLNPVKLINSDWRELGVHDIDATFSYLQNYRHSSYLDYVVDEKRDEAAILNRELFPDYFVTTDEHQKELLEWLGTIPRVTLGINP